MEIYLVRHTTPDIEKGVCYGQSDIGLSNSFKREAKVVFDKILLSNKVQVYSSPLKRCLQLAKEFSENIQLDNRLLELDFGNWELKKWNDIPKEEMDPWMKDFVNVKVPNGESYTQLAERSTAFYEDLLKKNHDQVIVVTHGGVLRSLLALLTEVSLENSFDIKVDYGQVSKITIANNLKVENAI